MCFLRQHSLTSTQTLLTFITFQGYHNVVGSLTSLEPTKISQTSIFSFFLLQKSLHAASMVNTESWWSFHCTSALWNVSVCAWLACHLPHAHFPPPCPLSFPLLFPTELSFFSFQTGMIVDARLKELTPAMPVIFIRAIPVDKQENRNVYQCPVYKTRQRGPTYVWTFNLKTKENPSKWTLAGVALLLQI